MKKVFVSFLVLLAASGQAIGQEKPNIYNPKADAAADIHKAVVRAAKEHKQVFVQVGGNWCIWCVRFHDLVERTDSLQRLMNDNYVIVHLNYSPENKNEKILATLGKPQQFGFPVFVILNGKGERIHTQNSSDLEEGKGHSPQKVAAMLRKWAVVKG